MKRNYENHNKDLTGQAASDAEDVIKAKEKEGKELKENIIKLLFQIGYPSSSRFSATSTRYTISRWQLPQHRRIRSGAVRLCTALSFSEMFTLSVGISIAKS